ncbi:hypothetical protein H4R33_003883, partial [Dimargaris cristalligena]
ADFQTPQFYHDDLPPESVTMTATALCADRIVYGYSDGSIKLLNRVACFENSKWPASLVIQAHAGPVSLINWPTDDSDPCLPASQLLTASVLEHSVKLWDAQHGVCLASFIIQANDHIIGIEFRPNRPVVIATRQGSIFVWRQYHLATVNVSLGPFDANAEEQEPPPHHLHPDLTVFTSRIVKIIPDWPNRSLYFWHSRYPWLTRITLRDVAEYCMLYHGTHGPEMSPVTSVQIHSAGPLPGSGGIQGPSDPALKISPSAMTRGDTDPHPNNPFHPILLKILTDEPGTQFTSLVTGHLDGTIRFWPIRRPPSLAPPAARPPPTDTIDAGISPYFQFQAHNHPVTHLGLYGTILVSADYRGQVMAWDCLTARPLDSFHAMSAGTRSVRDWKPHTQLRDLPTSPAYPPSFRQATAPSPVLAATLLNPTAAAPTATTPTAPTRTTTPSQMSAEAATAFAVAARYPHPESLNLSTRDQPRTRHEPVTIQTILNRIWSTHLPLDSMIHRSDPNDIHHLTTIPQHLLTSPWMQHPTPMISHLKVHANQAVITSGSQIFVWHIPDWYDPDPPK